MGNWLDFDPNIKDGDVPQWASYCPDRRGAAFKLHRNRGHAINAVLQQARSMLFKRGADGRWERVAVKDGPTARKEHLCMYCARDTKRGSLAYDYGRWEFARESGGHRVDDRMKLLFLCRDCQVDNAHGALRV